MEVFVPITDFKYFESNNKIEASFSLDGDEVAWIKNTSIENNGKTLRIRHLGVTTTRLREGIARDFLINLLQFKECSKVKEFVFEAVLINKPHWKGFLKKYSAQNIGIDSMYPHDSYRIPVANL